jgi:hypothetical protein
MFVWGPWEFSTGASEPVASNRTTRPRACSPTTGKNWDVFTMTRTGPGRWMSPSSQNYWNQQHADRPVRLLITCRREGHEPWDVLREVKPQPGGPFAASGFDG